MKRALIIILLILIFASIGVIGYLSLGKNTSSPLKTSAANPVNPFPLAQNIDNNLNNSPTSSSTTNTTNTDRTVVEGLNIVGLNNLVINKESKSYFIDKETGNLYSLDNQNNIKRQSFTTLPMVGEAYLGATGNLINVILRQIKGLNTVNQVGQIKLSTDGLPTELIYKEWIISPISLAIAPSGQKIAYLVEESGKGALYTVDWSLQKPKKIWSGNLSSWDISWPTNNLIAITTKSSYNYPGLSYLLNLTTGKAQKIIANTNGLSLSISPSGEKAIYSKSLLGSFSLYSYNIKTGESHLLGLNTLPDKCVWADADNIYCAVPRNIPAGRYPDDWYQGKISFVDNIWKIDLKQGITSILNQPKGTYDLTNLISNRESGWLYAINKGDNKLQAFTLSE